MMLPPQTLYFLASLLAFLFAIVGIAATYSLRHRRRQRYPYGKWEDLVKRLAPLDHDDLRRIAGYPDAGLGERIIPIESSSREDVWQALGGTRGIEAMQKNCTLLIDLAFYVQQWYPEALLIAEQLRLNAREVEWHIGRLKATSRTGRPPLAAQDYLQHAVAVYYQMITEVLALYEKANLPGLIDLQRAL